MTERPALMTVEQVADHLQVSKRTVYELRARNAIPFIRVGGQIRFRQAEIEAWLSDRTVAAVK